jgi:hypothetical protein
MNARSYGSVNLKIPVVVTTDAAGALYPDLATYASLAKREVKFIFSLGAFTTATGVTVSVTECDTTNGTYAAPANGTTSALFTTTAGGIQEINCRIDMRYVKCNWAGSPAGNYSMILGCVAVPLKREANS